MFSLEMLERDYDMASPEGKTEFFREAARRCLRLRTSWSGIIT